MFDGIMTGGWQYVVPAYLITAAVLGGYTLSLVLRRRSARRQDDEE